MTHRAFCDALAEETARVNAVSNVNNQMPNGNINYHFIGTNPIGPTMAQHHSSMFKPIISNINSNNDDDNNSNNTRRGLPLWMNQGLPQLGELPISRASVQEIHQLGVENAASLSFGNPLISCSTQSQSNYQMNWVFGNKFSPDAGEEMMRTSLPISSVKDDAVKVPLVYSMEHGVPHNSTPSANMSATALLAKAAQMGATSSTDPSSFLGNFGLKGNENQIYDNSKFCGLYTTSTVSASIGNDVESFDHFQNHPSKRRNIAREDGTIGNGQTRDFLGVGIQSLRHPSSINGWIN